MNESALRGPIVDLLRACCADLTAALDLAGDEEALGPSPFAGLAPREVASFVDLRSDDLKATLALVATVAFLRGTHPRRARALTPQELTGWASEIVNQLGGRLVNKLGRRGVALQIGLPGSLLGQGLALSFPEEDARVFDRDGMQIFFSIEEAAPAFEIPLEEPRGFGQNSQEGELVLF